jgi:hypothetical protein
MILNKNLAELARVIETTFGRIDCLVKSFLRE